MTYYVNYLNLQKTNNFRTVKSDADKETVQDDLTKLVKWSKNGRCYLILINVNASTLDMVIWAKNTLWAILYLAQV